MASRRAAQRVFRAAAPAVAARSATAPLLQLSRYQAPRLGALAVQRPVPISQQRWISSPTSKTIPLSFEEMQTLVKSPELDVTILDVREPHEYERGFIPGALNMPIKTSPDGIFLPPDEFEDRFGFTKPPTTNKIIFYCKAGVRSSSAAQLALQHGYTNVGEYKGSYDDWVKNGGENSKDPGMKTSSGADPDAARV